MIIWTCTISLVLAIDLFYFLIIVLQLFSNIIVSYLVILFFYAFSPKENAFVALFLTASHFLS